MKTTSALLRRAFLIVAVSFFTWHGVCIAYGQAGQESEVSLIAGFQDPPNAARPSAYYLMLNGYVNRDYIEKELTQLHDVGISGLCVFDMGARGSKEALPPNGPVFMSDAWLDNFAHIVRVAGKLGMDVQLAVSSSWDMGASWVEPKDASMALYHSLVFVEGPKELNEALPLPAIPAKAPRDEQGKPLFLRDVAALAFPASDDKPSEKTKPVVGKDSIVDLTKKLRADGHLQWKVPPGKWTIVRFVCANTGEKLKVPSPLSDGLATDHFSERATRGYIEYLNERLEKRLGDLRDTPLKQLYLPSYEVRGAVWTPGFVERFREYRGYDPTGYLPALIGYMIENKDITERFIYDFHKTQGDLLVDAYYRTASESARRVGLGIEAESGGPGPPVHQVPVDALKALGAIDEIRGEFWPWRMERDPLWVVKETACAAHVYGRQRVHMESFTGFYHWEAGPFELKPAADRAFCEGMNHVVWHTSSHQPPEAGKPGWVYGAGTHLTPNIVWWSKAKPFIDYLSRCSFMLQQGHFIADVCYYYGDQGFNFIPPKHIDPSLGYGYDYDVVNPEVILNRMSVEDGRIALRKESPGLPGDMRYELLVLPDREYFDLAVLQKIAELVKAGATIVGPKPTRSTGLVGYPDYDDKVRRLADSMWGDCDGKAVLEHRFGKGTIIWGKSLREILHQRGVNPDFQYTNKKEDTDIDYIHRRTNEADIYFVSNKTMQQKSVDGCFRVFDRAPEFWSAETGKIEKQIVYEQTDRGICLPLKLGPAGSVFVVFRKPINKQHLVSADPELEVMQIADDNVLVATHSNGSYRIKTSNGNVAQFKIDGIASDIKLDGPWKVFFQSGLGTPDSVVFEELKSWTESDDLAIRYYSGSARYEKEFDLERDWIGGNRKIYLDLGRLWCVAEVFVNGQSLGVVWKPPYRVDISEVVKAGVNKLEVEIANTWANRLVGDALGSDGERYCRTNITRSGTPGKAWKDVPLHQSGLLGPVKLTMVVEKTVALPGTGP